VGVGIDSPRHDILAAGVDLFESAGLIDFIGDLNDFPVSAQYVGAPGLVGGDNGSALD
jgi:hypothetical protein